MSPLLRRKSDGTFWRASHPGHPFFPGFYFVRVVPRAGLLGIIWPWRETGEVWTFTDPALFEFAHD